MNNNVKKRSKGLTVRIITTSAVLVALEIVLNRFCSINTFGWKIGFGDKPIKSPYYITKADFVACHNQSYIKKYDIVEDVKPGGVFMLDCSWDKAELEEHLPAAVKSYIANNNIKFYTIDATTIATKKIGNAKVKNTVLQSAFFALANILPKDEAIEYMKKMAYKSYIKKGQAMVDLNYAAIDAGADTHARHAQRL